MPVTTDSVHDNLVQLCTGTYRFNIYMFINENFEYLNGQDLFKKYMLSSGQQVGVLDGYTRLILGNSCCISSLLSDEQQHKFFQNLPNSTKRALIERHRSDLRQRMTLYNAIISIYYLTQIIPSNATNDEWTVWKRMIVNRIKIGCTKYHSGFFREIPVEANPTNLKFGRIGFKLAKVIYPNQNLLTYFTITDKVKMEVELSI